MPLALRRIRLPRTRALLRADQPFVPSNIHYMPIRDLKAAGTLALNNDVTMLVAELDLPNVAASRIDFFCDQGRPFDIASGPAWRNVPASIDANSRRGGIEVRFEHGNAHAKPAGMSGYLAPLDPHGLTGFLGALFMRYRARRRVRFLRDEYVVFRQVHLFRADRAQFNLRHFGILRFGFWSDEILSALRVGCAALAMPGAYDSHPARNATRIRNAMPIRTNERSRE